MKYAEWRKFEQTENGAFGLHGMLACNYNPLRETSTQGILKSPAISGQCQIFDIT